MVELGIYLQGRSAGVQSLTEDWPTGSIEVFFSEMK